MIRRAIGSILIILGTSVGAGMLALPVITAHESFYLSVVLLILAWSLSTIGAFALLEISLMHPLDTNLASMAKKTLGTYGRIVMWVLYLFLLYSLICAYLSGLSGILQSLFAEIHLSLDRSLATLICLFFFGSLVYQGIASVDIVNRALMGVKLISFILLVACVTKEITLKPIFQGDGVWQMSTFMVMLTSFGYSIVIPSIRSYLKNDRVLIIKVVLIGSLVPLLMYSLWIFAIQGVIPKTGPSGLMRILNAENTNGLLMQTLISQVHNNALGLISRIFISICALTSFLGVSIALTDFIGDGLSKAKKGRDAVITFSVAYLPPLVIVLVDPAIFIKALSYAGVCCLILLILMPLLMLYTMRYRQKIAYQAVLPFNQRTMLAFIILGFALTLLNMIKI